MSEKRIRRARPEEAAVLSDLAFRSKGYWGYDQEFLEACREDLTVTAECINENPVFVFEQDNRIAGFYVLKAKSDEEVELNFLFVDPESIGQGIGKALWKHAVETANELGFTVMIIHSDPFARPFYESMGAKMIGTIPSTVFPGRQLPLMKFSING